ncbi:MAG: hypothetical protein Q7S35_09390 [Candidatus Limnocylindrales bacterium]|nr:hypothetical protein [Candidatus Limnocylindrales bacterium]
MTTISGPRGVALAAAVALVALGCEAGSGAATPQILPGSSAAPREVNLIARDYAFVPDVLDLVPGETILLHVINGGLVLHEAVIGDASVQDAWEAAEAATVGAPPGPTPVVAVPPEVAGIRVVVGSGVRIDLTWTVPPEAADPSDATASRSAWFVGCHVPGHLAKGMQVPIRWVLPPSDAPASAPAP